ncbi:MAG TPA: PfkB family carbohydrate kinase [bacterium]|nr:PfkB family carbohydrate kinase [bacterium]
MSMGRTGIPRGIDVLGVGAVAVDDILFLREFPRPDSKMAILRRERHAGGLAGTALVAAQRLGRSCAYAGSLGEDALSLFILEQLSAEGISVEHVVRRDGARPYYSTILVDTARTTRTILFDANGVVGADPGAPPPAVLAGCRVLLVDLAGVEGMIRAARIARQAAVPVVADIERAGHPLLPDLLALSSHLVVPLDFAREITGAPDPAGMLRALWRKDRDAVVVTCGADGSWFLSSEDPDAVYHQPAFRVEVVDTSGCGDVFHGAYAAALSEGKPMGERMRTASAVAALKARKPGGQLGIPRREEADAFLRERTGETRALRA